MKRYCHKSHVVIKGGGVQHPHPQGCHQGHTIHTGDGIHLTLTCSANFSSDKFCLQDVPDDPIVVEYRQPYGQSWSLDEQCRQEFGPEFRLCRGVSNVIEGSPRERRHVKFG